MTTNANQNNDSNNVNSNENAGNESSFEFKGFPYVISILGENYTQEYTDLEDRLKDCIDKIAEKCTQGIWHWKKNVIPLFILFDSNNSFIKKVLEKKQEEYLSRKDRNIVLVEVVSNKFDNSGYKDICTYNEPACDPDCNGQKQERYFWRPKFDYQKEYSPQRQLNEFLVQHSHLSIIFNDNLYTDINSAPDDSLIWAIRFKLEGYPDSQYQQEQTEKITYPSIGPVLRIVKNNVKNNNQENGQENNRFITYFYPSREPITKQINNKARELNKKYIESCLLKDTVDFTEKPEVQSNIDVLKEINNGCMNNTNQIHEGKLHIEDLSLKKNRNQNLFKNEYEEYKLLIKQDDAKLKPLIKNSFFFQKLADQFKENTYRLTRRFCCTFLILFMCNAFLIYLNDVCIRSIGVNAAQFSCYYFNKSVPSFKVSGLSVDFNKLVINTVISDVNSISKTNNFIQNCKFKSFIIATFFCISAIALILSIIRIFGYYIVFNRNSYPRKYHIFQMLADCLRVQTYWKYAGMTDSINNNFRSHQIPAVDWLLLCLNGLNITTCPNMNYKTNLKEEKNENIEQSYFEFKIKHLDKIWLEDRIENEFKKELDKTEYTKAWESLTRISKSVVYLWYFIVLFLPFIFIFYSLLSNWIENCIYVWIVSGICSIVLSALSNFVIKSIINRFLINNDKTNDFFHKKAFDLILVFLVVLSGCLFGLFDLSRLSFLCSAAQNSYSRSLYISLQSFPEEFRLIIQLILAFVLVAFLYLRMQMFSKERKRINQLYSSFNVADYCIDVILTADDEVLKRMEIKENKLLLEKINNDHSIISKTPDDILLNDDDINSIQIIINNLKDKLQQIPNAKANLKDNTTSNNQTTQNDKKNKSVWWNPLSWELWHRNAKNTKSNTPVQDNQNSKSDTPDHNDNKEIIKGLESIEFKLFDIRKKKREILDNLKKNENEKEHNVNETKKIILFRRILLELGQEVLTKRTDWMLAVTDRYLQSPKQ